MWIYEMEVLFVYLKKIDKILIRKVYYIGILYWDIIILKNEFK